MDVSKVRKLSRTARLVYFMEEREAIRLRKESSQPKPWTDDEILQNYRFTNIRRMDDKVSQWLLSNWYLPNFDYRNMLPAVALARFINQPESLQAVGFPKVWNTAAIKKRLTRFKEGGKRVFNAAYMVRGNDGQDKIDSVVQYYVQPLVTDPIEIDRSFMRKTWTRLAARYGFGPFMAGQVVADLRWAIEGKWLDRNTWAPMGPGSKRGMNRLQGRELSFPMNQFQFDDDLETLINYLHYRLPELATRLEAIDVQNVLCEYDKYERILWGQGRPKQKYNGAK